MKTLRGYTILITTLISLLFAGIVLLSDLVHYNNPLFMYIGMGIVVVAGSFIIVRIILLRFVEEKINPVFKTIHGYTTSRKKLKEKIYKEDIEAELNEEVRLWANSQTEKIQKLKQTEKFRKDFLGNVSHELKTPIFNIQGYLLTLLDGGMKDLKINKFYLERAETSINRLISIVDDLDSIARLESGEFKLQIESFDLVKVVEEIFEAQELQAKKQSIKLVFDKNYNKPVKVLADRKRIIELIGNLVANSINYGKTGGKTIVGFIDTGKGIQIDVTDDGIGIAEKDLPRIFERFYRVDKSRSRDSGGTGLGLSIVKHTLQAHKKQINVRSKENRGTSFIFSLNKA